MSSQIQKKLRVAFVINALATGGAEIHTVTLANELKIRGYNCLLLPLINDAEISAGEIPLVTIGGNGLINLKAILKLAEEIEKFDPDLIVAVNGRQALYGKLVMLIKKARKRPLVLIYHTTLLLSWRQRFRYIFNLPFMNLADVQVYVSERQRDHCTRRGMRARRVKTIQNGIDGSRFHPRALATHREAMRAKLGIGKDDYVLGLSAAFRPEKNHVQAIIALKELRQAGISAWLILVGDGPCRPEIEAYVDAYGLDEVVILAGRQADVVPWISTFDVGLLTSTAIETFSLAALEFMAMGVPAVLSNIGGASELVLDGHNGRLFPAGDTSTLVKLLLELTNSEERARMGAASAERVKSLFTLGKMADAYDSLFEEVCVVR